ADELNVKAVRFVDDPAPYVSVDVSVRFDLAGPRLGARVQEVARALRAMDPADALRTLEREGRLGVPVEGETVWLSRDEVVARLREARGYAAQGEGGEFAILETTLTPDLVLEGQARELVHQLQLLRREAGLAVSDRVVLVHDGQLGPLLDAHGDYVRREILAVDVRADPARATAQVRLDGQTARVGLIRVPPGQV
ncbi:MAG: DUF5915 domain-containing protein, partial [Armatimonadota bacterium]|nr:DUF5915 domain-containing protein [Armatimonadota bacterium]